MAISIGYGPIGRSVFDRIVGKTEQEEERTTHNEKRIRMSISNRNFKLQLFHSCLENWTVFISLILLPVSFLYFFVGGLVFLGLLQC